MQREKALYAGAEIVARIGGAALFFAQKFNFKFIERNRFDKIILRKTRAAEALDLVRMLVQPDGTRYVQRIADLADGFLRGGKIVARNLDHLVLPDAVLFP